MKKKKEKENLKLKIIKLKEVSSKLQNQVKNIEKCIKKKT